MHIKWRYIFQHALLSLSLVSIGSFAQTITLNPLPAVALIADVDLDVNSMPAPGETIGLLDGQGTIVTAAAWIEADKRIQSEIGDLEKLLPSAYRTFSPMPWDFGYGKSDDGFLGLRKMLRHIEKDRSEGTVQYGLLAEEITGTDLDAAIAELLVASPEFRLLPREQLIAMYRKVHSEVSLRNRVQQLRNNQLSSIVKALPVFPVTVALSSGSSHLAKLGSTCIEFERFLSEAYVKHPNSTTLAKALESGIAQTDSRRGGSFDLLVLLRAECAEIEFSLKKYFAAKEKISRLASIAYQAEQQGLNEAQRAALEAAQTQQQYDAARRYSDNRKRAILDEARRYIDVELTAAGLSASERESFHDLFLSLVVAGVPPASLSDLRHAAEYWRPRFIFSGRLIRIQEFKPPFQGMSGDEEYRLDESDRIEFGLNIETTAARLRSRLKVVDVAYLNEIHDQILGLSGPTRAAVALHAERSARVRRENSRREIFLEAQNALAALREIRESQTSWMAGRTRDPEVSSVVLSTLVPSGNRVQAGSVLLTAFPANSRQATWTSRRGHTVVPGQIFRAMLIAPPAIPIPPSLSTQLSSRERGQIESFLNQVAQVIVRQPILQIRAHGKVGGVFSEENFGTIEHDHRLSIDITDIVRSSSTAREAVNLLNRSKRVVYEVDDRFLFRPIAGLLPINGRIEIEEVR